MIGRVALERDLLIVACAISAGIHAALAPDHLAEGAGAGVGFAVSALALAGLAVALTRRLTVPALAGAVVVFAGLLAAYALAITTGVPLLHPESEPVVAVALFTKVVELVALLAVVHLLTQARAAVRPIPIGLTGLIACFSALVALAVSSGHTHGHGERKTSGRSDTNLSMQIQRNEEHRQYTVVDWRREQLAAAGFALPLASTIARSSQYDLHALIELVERGCPPELAVRILEPLEGAEPV